MLTIDNPTPNDLALITAFQRKRLVELNLKPRWSAGDFEEVFQCQIQWRPDAKAWCVPVEALRDLAFDSRTPDAMAAKLQQLISSFDSTQAKKGGEQ